MHFMAVAALSNIHLQRELVMYSSSGYDETAGCSALTSISTTVNYIYSEQRTQMRVQKSDRLMAVLCRV